MRLKQTFCILLTCFGTFSSVAQDSLSYEKTKTLRLAIDANAFIKNNEYNGHLVTGYTLPGFWIRPRATFDPSQKVHLEFGVHAIMFNGASKYPNYAFHDVATWKGNQYTNGAHLTPWFRAEAYLGKTTVTVGTLHRDEDFHNLSLPMFNPEMELSADPEQGSEVRINLSHYKLDAWIDWQSFIYKKDKHQEAFIFGATQEFMLTKPTSDIQLSIPLQVIIQHRGGEIDETETGTQTIDNAAVGLRAGMPFRGKTLNNLQAEVLYLHTWQQTGRLIPFDHGNGLWGSIKGTLWNSINCQLGVFHAKDFTSICGSPYFGTVSISDENGRYSRMTTGYYSAEYRYPLGSNCSIAVNASGYINAAGDYKSDTRQKEAELFHSFDFGISFRSGLDFLLKDFKR